MSGTGPRPWLAGLLALVYPGLGHVYIRAWGRALLWFVLTVGTTIFVVPEGILTEVDPLANPMGASEAISTATPTMGMISILMVVGFSVVDAYLTARRNSQQNNTVSKGDSARTIGAAESPIRATARAAVDGSPS